ncbi:MAG: molybdate ABC transporter permease subunit [Bradymonadia bacterium]
MPSLPPALILGTLLAVSLVGVLALPVVALALSSDSAHITAGLSHPLFAPALWLSVKTTLVSLAITIVTGTPLAWWLVTRRSPFVRATEIVVGLPVIIPPAVIGVALLQAFGRQGILGPTLSAWGLALPFTEAAVVTAQVVVSAPFFVQGAANAFRKVDPDLLVVARTLGASPTRAFFSVALPIALPGLLVGISMAWARALGEFGATLIFAGNLSGTTQTMPLAIFTALESDVRLAVVLSLALVAVGGALLLLLRGLPALWRRTSV